MIDPTKIDALIEEARRRDNVVTHNERSPTPRAGNRNSMFGKAGNPTAKQFAKMIRKDEP